jgi:nitrogen fixation/metabolism regulation signal transduction histidine kinase
MHPIRFSLAGKVSAIFGVCAILSAGISAALSRFDMTAWQVFALSLLPSLILGFWLLNRFLRPVRGVLQAITDGMRSFHDKDYGVRIAVERRDELGLLVSLYNEVGEILHRERKGIHQRELLLQTALDRSPAAIVLLNSLDRVVYANVEARRLFMGGERLKGVRFGEVLERCPPEMAQVLEERADGLFTVEHEGERETYHVSRRRFTLNGQPHALYLLRRLTAELGRQEAEIWKQVIRVISHELNNSLAPISSLAHSAEIISQDPDRAERLSGIFSSIRQNTEHLKEFLEGYARFARLPEPRRQPVSWKEFIGGLRAMHAFDLIGEPPAEDGYFDPGHMQQVLTNLLKNAAEASDGRAEVAVRISPASDGGTFIQVLDRGRGLSEEVMRGALLPFYSTKKGGAGLGLSLCREILEAHRGRIRIQNRDGGGTVVTCWLPPHDGGRRAGSTRSQQVRTAPSRPDAARKR